MLLEPVTVLVHGRAQLISVAELRAELDAEGPPRSLVHLEAICRCSDRAGAVTRLRRLVRSGDPGVNTTHAVLGLVRLDAATAASELEALALRLGGSPGAIARAAALLVADRLDELARLVADDALVAHHSPRPYLHLSRVPVAAPVLFAAWIAALRRDASQVGVTAFRAFAGDIAEALFRSLQRGGEAGKLLESGDRGFLVDTLCAELPGTTDFIAARGMAWLLGALEPSDETARAAIERARDRFRDPAFAADCEAMLRGERWPPPPPA
jgi:hypothetical protein